MPQLVVITRRAPNTFIDPCHISRTVERIRSFNSAVVTCVVENAPACIFIDVVNRTTYRLRSTMPAFTINDIPFNDIKVSANSSMKNIS